jgi:hypothetical protein
MQAATAPAANSPRHGGAAAVALSTSPSAASAAAAPGGVFALLKSWGDDKVGEKLVTVMLWQILNVAH